MENNYQHADVHKNIMNALSKSNISKEKLSSISKTIASGAERNLRIIDWHWLGTVPYEKFVLEAELATEEAGLLEKFYQDENIREITILRKGIPPVVDFFNVNLTFQNEMR